MAKRDERQRYAVYYGLAGTILLVGFTTAASIQLRKRFRTMMATSTTSSTTHHPTAHPGQSWLRLRRNTRNDVDFELPIHFQKHITPLSHSSSHDALSKSSPYLQNSAGVVTPETRSLAFQFAIKTFVLGTALCLGSAFIVSKSVGWYLHVSSVCCSSQNMT